ncbi:MAG TPA: maleylpyruvate isomerase family mycothiol-dependent enzyme [Acidimicrobiales bacterium]|jgi:uncharacterized protein (TIGR03083 family)|nr:maleylpyruvate isomerase family mycothiol-dependent enzyme [Acidimicrobiales bacterium]
MDTPLSVLRASVGRLHDMVSGLSDAQLSSPSYCDDWSIAQVLSHLGSGAVIARRGLQDAQAGTSTPEDFNTSVWDEWNAKAPRAQADDALKADAALMEAYDAVDEDERAQLVFPLGPLSLGFDELVGLRLNEHTFHSWDIAVMLDEAARLPGDATALVVDNLALIARFSARPEGQARTIAVRTTDPGRAVALRLAADGVELGGGETGQQPDLELPAEAFCRLVYGRLDPDHPPAFTGDPALVSGLRAVFPGP